MTPSSPPLNGSIPSYLASRNRWILWRTKITTDRKTGEKRATKMPISYHTSKACDVTAPGSWTDYTKIESALKRTPGTWDGPGFALGIVEQDEEIALGLDLDYCLNPDTGRVADWAQMFLDAMPSYAEISPGGAGTKIIARLRLADLATARRLLDIPEGDKDQARTRTFGEQSNGQHAPSAQLFLMKRYFAITGRRWPASPDDVTMLTLEQIAELGALFGPREQRPNGKHNGSEDDDETPDDVAVKDKLRAAFARNPRLKERWKGSTAGLNDMSRSGRDMSVLAKLVTAGFTKGETRGALHLFRHGKIKHEPPRYFEEMWRRTKATPHPEPEPCLDWEAAHPPPEDDALGGSEPDPDQPRPDDPNDDAMAEAEIIRLVALPPLAYAREQRASAKRLHISATILDKLVQQQRSATASSSAPPAPPADTPEVTKLIAEFNSKYFVLNENGKAVIYAPKHDPILNRRFFERLTFADLDLLYLNRHVKIGKRNGIPVFAPVAAVWTRHRSRRQYIGGVVFDPSNRQQSADVLNLWQGFAVAPKPGSWALLMEHTRTIICGGNTELFDYLLGWMADLVQNPAKQGEVAIVMRGGEGTGKGILARAIKYLMGQHGFAISNAKHLTGNFNAHLRDCVLLFADEALYAGDKAHVGILKSIITEPYLTIEGKYQNAVMSPNYLHLILASNEQWVVPASLESRRFFVLDVSNERANDHLYFAAIQHELDHGGHEAMLHELLRRTPVGNLRRVPVTDALVNQRKLSLGVTEGWWLDCLHRGYIFTSKLGLEEHFAQWHEEVATELLFTSYLDHCRACHERRLLSRELLARWLRSMGCKPVRPRGLVVVGEHITNVTSSVGNTIRGAELIERDRAPCYACGSLEEASKAFTEATALTVDWGVYPDEPVREAGR